MKILACGSRTWYNRTIIWDTFSRILDQTPPQNYPITVVEGGAKGADTLCREVAEAMHFHVIEMPADWDKYGNQAGFIRNQKMIESGVDLVVAFWDGKSRGTKHTLELAKKYGIPYEIHYDPSL